MDQFRWLTGKWWVLHAAAIAFFFWLGHVVGF